MNEKARRSISSYYIKFLFKLQVYVCFGCVRLQTVMRYFCHRYQRVDEFRFYIHCRWPAYPRFCVRKKQAERNIASLSAQKYSNVLLCLSFFPTGIQRHTLLHRPCLYVPFFRRRTIQIPSGKTIPLSRRFINGKQCAMFNADA